VSWFSLASPFTALNARATMLIGVSDAVGSTDCVRGLVVLPDLQFASCSNDGNIHIWSFSGETMAILTGHTSFVYSLTLLPDGDLASSGEDHSCVPSRFPFLPSHPFIVYC
jgi:WD40 repeat protein